MMIIILSFAYIRFKKYFIKCYKIRKKLIYDLNGILKMIYNNIPINEISEINSSSLKFLKNFIIS